MKTPLNIIGLSLLAIAVSAATVIGVAFLSADEPTLGAPYFEGTRGQVPNTDSEYYSGTTTPSTKAWKGMISDEFCLTGDTCITSWAAGSSNWTDAGVYKTPTGGDGIIITASSTFTAHTIFSSLFSTRASTTHATSTNLAVTSLLTFNGVTGDEWTDFCTTITGGAGLCDGTDATGAGDPNVIITGGFYRASTTGNSWLFPDGFVSQASSTVSGALTVTGTLTGTLTGNASTATALAANGGNCSSGNAPLGVDASGAVESCFDVWTEAENTSAGYTSNTGTVTSIATTWPIIGGPITTTGTLTFGGLSTSSAISAASGLLYATGVNTLASVSTSSAITMSITGNAGTATALAANAANCSAGSAAGGVDASGAAEDCTAYAEDTRTLTVAGTANEITSSAGAQDLSANRTWTLALADHVIFNSDGFESAIGSTTNATSTNLTITGNAIISGLTSALIQAGSDGLLAEYAGTSCTNQFVRSLSVLGAATCATVGAADVSLANLTATDASITFSGTYNGSTARTIGVNLGHNFAWTGAHDFGGATSLEIPNGTGPTVDATGELALDTTSNNLILATSTSHFVVASASTSLYALSIASTSPDFASGGVLELPPHPLPQTVMSVGCAVDGGTNKVVVISDDGTNDLSPTLTCTTTWQWFTVTANNNFTANERIRLEIGASSGSPDYLLLRIMGFRRTD